jgi:hypothetical protein
MLDSTYYYIGKGEKLEGRSEEFGEAVMDSSPPPF